MSNKAGKIWGETELILANNSLEFHRIDYKKGGVCSKHLHEWKWNGFYVMSGQMKIRVWQKDYDLVDETILNPGDFTAVKPGLYHSFEGLEDGVAFVIFRPFASSFILFFESKVFMGTLYLDGSNIYKVQ